jgi:hypothetical protein
MNKIINKIIITGLLILFLLVVAVETSTAQTYNSIITWQADSFYPADYKGKAPAVFDSTVSVSLTILENGRTVDTSSSEIIWYLDNKFFKKGIGLTEVAFTIDKTKGGEHFLRAVVSMPEESLEKSVTIPVGSRELVINNPRPSNLIKFGEKVVLEAVPYFFNVTSLDYLSFFWSVDNVLRKEERTSSLILNTGASESLKGADVLITAQAANKNKPIESAKSNLELSIR